MKKILLAVLLLVLVGCEREPVYNCSVSEKELFNEAYAKCLDAGYHATTCTDSVRKMFCDEVSQSTKFLQGTKSSGSLPVK